MSTVHTGGPQAIGATDRALVEGDVVGEYVVIDQLGKGGFGTVYRAAHPVIGKQVAIKVLSRRYSSDEAIVSRFVAEARAVNQIRHRNIIDIFSFGNLPDGRHYYVMEYLDGTPLDRYLKERGALTLELALPILRAIARALDAAHAKGIAHRDLKPENIVLTFDEDGHSFPKLLDFGIAKLTTAEEEQAHRTGTGVPIGTPYYMSPEQCRGRDVDHRTDIYSLGILTFRLLTGDYPFHGEMIEILHKQMHDAPPAASSINAALSPEVDRAIAWMMQKDPAARPSTATSAVGALAGDAPATTPAITPSTLSPPTVRIGPRAAAGTDDTLAAASTIAPTSAPASRAPWLVGLVLVAGAVGVVAWTQLRDHGTTSSPVAEPQKPPAPAPVLPPPTPPATVAPPAVHPDHVIITLEGAPPGTRVLVAGTEVGFVPDVQLAYSEQATVLSLVAEGYVARTITVTPDRTQRVPARLDRVARPIKRPLPPAPPPGKDDILPFPTENRSK
ncbi:MAG: protein kinase [Myxococcales bacterium]|nr:protein kinase [Myxococcales bacterium]